jgi:hypothetical protein
MIQILKPDYSQDYVNKNLKLFAESCGVAEDDLSWDVCDGAEPSLATW